jgi:hypothetical protein
MSDIDSEINLLRLRLDTLEKQKQQIPIETEKIPIETEQLPLKTLENIIDEKKSKLKTTPILKAFH